MNPRSLQSRRTHRQPMAITLGLALALTIGACCVWFFVVTVGLTTWEETHRQPSSARANINLVFDARGRLLIETALGDVQSYVDIDGRKQSSTNLRLTPAPVTLSDWRIIRSSSEVTTEWPVKPVGTVDRISWFFHDRGGESYLEGFEQKTALPAGFIGRNGLSSDRPTGDSAWKSSGDQATKCLLITDDARGGLFLPYHALRLRNALDNALRHSAAVIVSEDGRRVDLLDISLQRVQRVYEGDVVRSASIHRDETSTVVLRTDRDLVLIPLTLNAAKVVKLPIPESIRKLFILSWHPTPDGSVFVVPAANADCRAVWVNAAGTVLDDRMIAIPKTEPAQVPDFSWAMSIVQSPFAVGVIAMVSQFEYSLLSSYDLSRARELGYELPKFAPSNNGLTAGPWIGVLLLSSLFWSGLAVRRLNTIKASRNEKWLWGLWVFIWGLPGWMAFRVHREWPALRRCEACQKLAPVNEPSCAQCGADWNLHSSVVTQDTTASKLHLRRAAPRQEGKEFVSDRNVGAMLLGGYSRALDVAERVGCEVAFALGLPPGPVALVMKESRLVAGLMTLAGIIYTVMLARLMDVKAFVWFGFVGPNHQCVPFLQDQFMGVFVTIASGLALLLAVLQVGAEIWGDAWLFWLHRPVSRRLLIGSKLVVGLSASAVCSAAPILFYGWWCSLPGRVAAPFDWGMTADAWSTWGMTSTIYLATFLTLLRPARWWLTRCLPLAAVSWAWMAAGGSMAFVVIGLADVALLACIFFVAKDREYP